MPCHPDRVRRHYQPPGPAPRLVRPPRSFSPPETVAAIARARVERPWRRPSENAAEQLERFAAVTTDNGFTANVIEGELFDEPDGASGGDAPGAV